MRTASIAARVTSAGSVTFPVSVSPRAKRNAVEGVVAGALRIRLAAPPVEGRANEALCHFLAECLNIPRSAVRIVAGERSRQKRVEARGVALDRVLALASDVPQQTAGKDKLTGDRPAARRGGEPS